MASKKSKVLAIAFCAAVMAGIHVNPVLAAVKHVDNGSVTVGYKDFDTTTGTGDVEDAQVTITNIASQDDLEATQQAVEKAQQTANEVAADVETIQTNDQYQNDRLDIHESQIGALKESDQEQDSAISKLQKNDAAHDQAISDLEVKNDKQNSAIAGLDALLKEETADRKKADADLQDQIDGHTNQIDSMGDQLDDLKTKDEAQDETLKGHTNQIDSMGDQLDDLKANDEVQDNRLQGVENKNVEQDNRLDNHEDVMGAANSGELQDRYADTNYISGAADMAEADVILDREISRVDGRVDRLENRVDGLEDRIDKVGAMSAAIANLRTMGYDPAAPTEVAVGVGQYRDETGMALGLFHYPNRDFMLSLSVSTSGDEYMGGIGATWKFGRKSPEKVAEIKKAQAEADARRAEEQKLAKAEEMKKAAKEAKVQAQMERHAKLAAERAALEEA